eukprot:COSAG02_NODE_8649_length_2491_cov_1.619565_1_plen_70_part_00
MHTRDHGRGRGAGPGAQLLTLLGKRCDKAHITGANLDSRYLSMARWHSGPERPERQRGVATHMQAIASH